MLRVYKRYRERTMYSLSASRTGSPASAAYSASSFESTNTSAGTRAQPGILELAAPAGSAEGKASPSGGRSTGGVCSVG